MLALSISSKHWITQILWIIFWALLAMGVSQLPAWQTFERKGFDLLRILSADSTQELPIYIVGIDDASMQQINQRWPWPRDIHAQLIDRLRESGASIIAFDIIFGHPATDEEDQALAKAIQRAGNVVLAAGTIEQETSHGTLWQRIEPIPALQEAGAVMGLVDVKFDPDLVVRNFPDNQDAFWRVTLKKLLEQIPEIEPDLSSKEGELIHFLGPAETFTYIPYHEVLEPGYLQPGDLEGTLILVGRTTSAAADIGMAQVDLFATPMTMATGQLMPGVEIHANLIENAVRNLSIHPIPPWGINIAIIITALLSVIAVRRFHVIGSAALLLVLMGILAGLSWLLFTEARLWLPVAAAMAIPLLVYGASAIASFLQERQQKQEFRRQFSLYVPKKLVDQIAEQSSELALGGEHREITILFTDLAGFTNAAEHLPPRDVAQLLNEYFQEMTDILFRHDGTLDKFIGDAIMAFWGAPVTDPEHARKGLRAATEMQAAMPALNRRLEAAGFSAISMRLGLHTGTAMVGNLGSTSRFSYTAIGDAVNLASRLEGANKQYGTKLLISEDTARAAAGEMPLRIVDRVRVKGKIQAVELYTPAIDPNHARHSDEAMNAFREGRWDESAVAWKQLLTDYPEDPLASIYLDRLRSLKGREWSPDWDWGTTLETK